MLEDCTTLGACEERLEQWVNGGILLGEIPLSRDDVRRLADLVAPAIASEPGHLRLVGRQAPSCLACLLVWLGLRGYREGDYWSAVRTALGLPKDANWESRWGRWFLAYLKTRGLPLFDIPGAHTYVGPILMHGGIPDSCLPEFFERVLIPLFRRLPDPTDPAVVCRELAYLREDDGLRSALVRERGALTERARVRRRLLAVQRRAATIYKELEAVWALEEEASGQDHAAHLPRDWASYQEAMVQRKHALKQDLCALWQECEREVALARRLTPQDRRVLSARSTIDAAGEVAQHLRGKVQALQDLARLDVDIEQQITAGAQCILSEPWQPDYGEAVLSLPLDRLREAIRTLDALTAGSAHTRGSAAIINATADDAGLRRQRTLALAVLACGTACVTWGVGAERALPPLVLGGSLLAAAGWAGWSWRRRSMAQAAMTREATEAVESADAAQACARKEVLALLQGLPLRDEHACAPSVALHDALLALRESCARLTQTVEARRCLEAEVAGDQETVARVARDLGLEPMATADATAKMLAQRLEETEQRQVAAEEAGHAVEGRHQRRAAEIEHTMADLDDECLQVEAALAAIGGGDPAVGAQALFRADAARERAGVMRAALAGAHSDLESLERLARDARAKGGIGALERDIEADERALASLRKEAEALGVRCANVAEVWPGVDEPIRRYLLHAGEHADHFLIGSLSMVKQAASGDLRAVDGVPDRVTEAFRDWWLARQETTPPTRERPTPTEPEAGDRFVPPVIALDPVVAEITVHLPPQSISMPAGNASASFRVSGSEGQQCDHSVRLYKLDERLCQTQDLEFPLPFPSTSYTFGLQVGGETVQEWVVDLFGQDVPYAVFDAKRRRLSEGAALERTRVWLVGPVRVAQPEESIDELVELYGQWRGHACYCLDLSGVDQLTLVDGKGATHHLPVAPDELPGAGLSGGHAPWGVTCEGHPVYVGAPPVLMVPLVSTESLRIRRLSIVATGPSSLGASQHLRLGDLVEGVLARQAENGLLEVDLRSDVLLGPEPVGLFTAGITDMVRLRWSWTFCVVPTLDVAFDPAPVFPTDGDARRAVRARVACGPRDRFAPHPPAVLEGVAGGASSVVIEGDAHTFSGELFVSGRAGQRVAVPLTMEVPEVRWRLEASDRDAPDEWRTGVCELWWGDDSAYRQAVLLLQVPDPVGASARISLDGDQAQGVSVSFRDGRARVPMAQFGDSLAAGAPLRTFSLALRDASTGVQTGALFRARTRWEAVHISCQQSAEGDDIILDATWEELGLSGGRARVVRLWSEAEQEPICVGDGTADGRATLRASMDLLPPGTYSLEVALDDPWSPGTPAMPAHGAPSTITIDIVSFERVRQGQALIIQGVVDAQQRVRPLRYRYTMRIVGRIIGGKVPAGVSGSRVLVTYDNEGWYVGEIASDADASSGFALVDVNPVKFGYDEQRQRIFAIEDRDGDGAMYSATYQALFWAQDILRREQRLKNAILGPIEAFSVE